MDRECYEWKQPWKQLCMETAIDEDIYAQDNHGWR